MVVFRIKGKNDLTERLLKRLNHRGNLHCVPASLKGKYVIRWIKYIFTLPFCYIQLFFAIFNLSPFINIIFNRINWKMRWSNVYSISSFTITSTYTTNDDLIRDWAEIRKVTTELLEDLDIHISDRVRVQLKGSSHIHLIHTSYMDRLTFVLRFVFHNRCTFWLCHCL